MAPAPEDGAARSPAVNANVDPIVGCYQWFNNSPVVIHADGTMIGGAVHGALAAGGCGAAGLHVHVAGDD